MEWDADAVICTLPIGVLKSHSVQFIPELSTAKLDAIHKTGSGNVVKIILEFPKVFWPTHTTFFGIADDKLCNDVVIGSTLNSLLPTAGESDDGACKRGLCTFFLNGHKVCGKKILVTYGLGDAADIIDTVSDLPWALHKKTFTCHIIENAPIHFVSSDE